MASIEVARAWAQYSLPSKLEVDILTVEVNDEIHSAPMRPSTFIKYPHLLNYYKDDSHKITQPKLKDILNAGVNTALTLNYEIIVYSNMDINVMPHFYAIVDKVSDCYENYFINRVEIPNRIVKDLTVLNRTSEVTTTIENVEDIYTDKPINLDNIEEGYKYALQFNQLHPGYDCMVTTPTSLEKIISNIGEVFVGHPPVGSVLAKATKLVDSRCITLRGLSATFHVGSRNGHWNSPEKELLNDLNGELGKKSNAMKKKSQKPCQPYSMMKSRKRKTCFPDIYPDIPLRLKFKLPEDKDIKIIK